MAPKPKSHRFEAIIKLQGNLSEARLSTTLSRAIETLLNTLEADDIDIVEQNIHVSITNVKKAD